MLCHLFKNLLYHLLFLTFIAILIPILTIFEVIRQLLKLYLHMVCNEKMKFLTGTDTIFFLFPQFSQPILDGVFIFKGKVDIKRIQDTVQSNWTSVKKNGHYKHPRLRSIVKQTCGYFYWTHYQNFNIQDHVVIHNCPLAKNQNELNQVLSKIFIEQFPLDKPQWKVYAFPLAESYGNEPRYAIVTRLHHGLVDGLNGVRLLSECFLDDETVQHVEKKSYWGRLTIGKLVKSFYKYPRYIGYHILHKDVNILHGPDPTGVGLCAVSSSISMDRFKRIQEMTATTINDIAISCIAAAFSKYFKLEKAPPINIRCVIPVSMNDGSRPTELVNNTSIVAVSLPVFYGNAMDMLKQTQHKLDKVKATDFCWFNQLLVSAIYNRLPSSFIDESYRMNDFTYYVSNVPFYKGPCVSQFGDELLQVLPFPPFVCKTVIALAVTSYNGNVQVLMKADKAVLSTQKYVDYIMNYFDEGFRELELSIDT